MALIEHFNAFWAQMPYNPISANALALHYALTYYFNHPRWQWRSNEIPVSNDALRTMAGGLTEKQFRSARAELVTAGIITFKAGKKNAAPIYSFINLGNYSDETGQSSESNQSKTGQQSVENRAAIREETGRNSDVIWTETGRATAEKGQPSIERDRDIERDREGDIYSPPISPQGETKPKRRSTKTELERVPEEQPEEPKAPETPSERRKAGKKPSDAIELTKIIDEQDESLREPLRGFVETRKKLKKPLTPHALELSIKKLYRMSDSPKERADIVDQAVMNGWLTFYPLKNERQNEDVFTQIMREEAEKEAQYIDTDRDFTGLKAHQNCISSQLF